MKDLKELWCLGTAGEGCKCACEGAVVSIAKRWQM